MLYDNLSEIIANAEKKSAQSLAEHKAAKKLWAIPWLSPEQALPQNDFETPAEHRRLFLVRLMPGKNIAIAQFGYDGHDWWVSPSGKLFTSYFGQTVVGWCPLPSSLGNTTCNTTEETSSRER